MSVCWIRDARQKVHSLGKNARKLGAAMLESSFKFSGCPFFQISLDVIVMTAPVSDVACFLPFPTAGLKVVFKESARSQRA